MRSVCQDASRLGSAAAVTAAAKAFTVAETIQPDWCLPSIAFFAAQVAQVAACSTHFGLSEYSIAALRAAKASSEAASAHSG
jgi:hypothetical protein